MAKKAKSKTMKLPKGVSKKAHKQWLRIHKQLDEFLTELDENIGPDIEGLLDDDFVDVRGFKADDGMLTIASIALERFLRSMSHIPKER